MVHVLDLYQIKHKLATAHLLTKKSRNKNQFFFIAITIFFQKLKSWNRPIIMMIISFRKYSVPFFLSSKYNCLVIKILVCMRRFFITYFYWTNCDAHWAKIQKVNVNQENVCCLKSKRIEIFPQNQLLFFQNMLELGTNLQFNKSCNFS